MATLSARAPAGTSLGSARFRAVIGMTLVVMVGFGLIVPALPAFVESLGGNKAGVGIVITAFSLTRLFGDLFAGRLIDRLGERVVTALGAGIVGVSSAAAAASQTFTQLVVLRGLGGFGSAFFLGGLMAYLIGTTPADQRGRAMSIFQGSFGLGFLIGPAIGGAMLAVTSPNIPLYVYGGCCLICVPLTLRALGSERVSSDSLADAPSGIEPEGPPAPRAPAWRRIRPLLNNSAYRAALGASALMFFVSQAQFTLVRDFWRDTLKQPDGTSGIPFTVIALFGLVVIWHAGALTDRRGRKSALVPALAATAIATAALGFTGNWIVALALLGITGAASGYIRPGPSAIVGDVTTSEDRAVAVGGFRFAGDLGGLIGPILAGVVAQYVSFRAAWIAIGAAAALVFLLALVAEETAPSQRAR
jgi:MFS family permease